MVDLKNSALAEVSDDNLSLAKLAGSSLVVGSDASGISLADETAARDTLTSMRKAAALRFDGQKLAMANHLIDALWHDISVMIDPEKNKRVADNIATPFDDKLFMEAAEKRLKMLQNLMRMDSVGTGSTAARIAVALDIGDGRTIGGSFGIEID